MLLSGRIFVLLLAGQVFSSTAGAEGFSQREEVLSFINEMHADYGIDTDSLLRDFSLIQPQPRAIKAIQPPKDAGGRSWQKYRGRFITSSLIEGGVRFWDANEYWLKSSREIFGIPEEISIAIIGVETIYGRHQGNFPTLATLATLAFDYPPRSELFRRELKALLLLSRESGNSALTYVGSYAGALGIAQFLPSSIRSWGIDFDADGKTDLSSSNADAIGSVANFLASHGWQAGNPIAIPASASGEQVTELIKAGIEPRLTPAEMQPFGVAASSPAPQLPCALIDLATPNHPTEYWLGYRNFYAITRYNRSSFYAMTIFLLSREIKTARDARMDQSKTSLDTP